jgi:hypothetical protein
MAKTAILSLCVQVSGDGLKTETYVPPQSPASNGSAPGGVPQPYALEPGANTIDVPTGAVFALVVPPQTSTNAKLAKVVSGDTGFPFTAGFALLPVSSLASFVLTSTAAESVDIAWC